MRVLSLCFLCFLSAYPSEESKQMLKNESKRIQKEYEKVLYDLSILSEELVEDIIVADPTVKKKREQQIEEQADAVSKLIEEGEEIEAQNSSERNEEMDFLFKTIEKVNKKPVSELSGLAIDANSDLNGELSILETTPPALVEECKEVGTSLESIEQYLDVHVTTVPEKSKKVCLGHLFSKEFNKISAANCYLSEQISCCEEEEAIWWGEKCKSSIKKSLFGITGYKVDLHLFHKDDMETCNHFENRVVEEERKVCTKTWHFLEEEMKKAALFMESPECRPLHSECIGKKELRMVNEVPFNEHWKRRLFFACDSQEGSACSAIRDKGGVLIAKECVQEDLEGKCLLWKKSYNLSLPISEKKVVFSGEKSVEEVLEDFKSFGEYEKSKNFFSSLAKFFLSTAFEKETSITSETPLLFSGVIKSCYTLVNNCVSGCCGVVQPKKKKELKGKGLLPLAHFSSCSESEKELAVARGELRASFIRSQGKIDKKQVYCVFPTKLARILNEKARIQLNLDWRNGSKKQCGGFTQEEIEAIDFDKIDFSEAFDDFNVDSKRIIDSLRSLSTDPQDLPNNQFNNTKEQLCDF